MSRNQHVEIKKHLLPVSWIYGLITYIRNKLFDRNILKSKRYDIPIICVGNLTVGGTGKTPHTEYLIRILMEKQYRVGVLSRGYRRKSKGYVLATSESTSFQIGDEPYQIKQKYPSVILAVDGDRRRGIENLLALTIPPQVIILDDGFQHRYVKPSLSIVLSNYYRPVYEDKLLPAGMLRESIEGLERAHIVVVTKCPNAMQPIDYRIITTNLEMMPFQSLFFSTFRYQQLVPLYNEDSRIEGMNFLQHKDLLLISAIASPELIIKKLSEYSTNVSTLTYEDHHSFDKGDIEDILSKIEEGNLDNKVVVVTEKDATKLTSLKNYIPENMQSLFYILPIEVGFTDLDSERRFRKLIYNHVSKSTENSKIH